MDKKVKISSVSYLNSKPFVYGIIESQLENEIELSLDIPSKVAFKLKNDEADIGLVPVAAMLENERLQVVTDKCIGSVGNVRTVVLASEVPLEQIDNILMDYQSRTSVMLAKVLAKFFWNKTVSWENTCSGFENKSIKGKTAAVVIGDRVFDVEGKYPYIYDLSTEWKNYTGLPFVFAVWAANKPINLQTVDMFDSALNLGLSNINEVVKTEETSYPGIDIFTYLTHNIQFILTDEMKKGMELFLELARKIDPV